MITDLLKKAAAADLTKEDAAALLQIKNGSREFYDLLALANEMTRTEYKNQAYIFSQIGLNAQPCPMNCKFCSMAESNYVMDGTFLKTMEDIEDILETVRQLIASGTHDLFLMTTAHYDFDEFLKIAGEVKKILPDHVRFVANVGDFDEDQAACLKEAGFTGVYHIRRLGEGIDTDILPERRIRTLDNIKNAGLELYYCVEPIGPEHTYEEIADEMLRARDYGVEAMAVMRRTPVPGTPLADKGRISSVELAKIAAVARLVTKPSRSMNAHEVTPLTLSGGVNQLYAEVGANPRDQVQDTAGNRGYGVLAARDLLLDAEYEMA